MKYLNLYVEFMLQHIGYFLFIYFILIFIQVICLYYEYNKKNLVLFLGNKGIFLCSILIGYFFKDNTMILFIYIIGLVLLTNFVDKKYDEEYSSEMRELFLQDIFFISISGLISFYII